eukprot:TRINITY_DN11771_c0_g1_i1.p1 TRINITY_DN11771_c0_g1~~TRINITY_DN11771_c0_g1_i1.p1  ORF type:complete len:365 (+),score=59.57 TRINITY_DN11771_c0_g1_i1:124-1218(+)
MSHAGVVKNWFNAKGFGFITSHEDCADVFTHVSDLGFGNALQPGASVTYDLGQTDSGRVKAVNVQGGIIPDPEAAAKGKGAGRGDGARRFEPYPTEAVAPEGSGQMTGKVTNWHADKGFGFIQCDQDGQQVFVHYSDIGGGSLVPGSIMRFDLAQGTHEGKMKAVNITGYIGPRIGRDGQPRAGAGGGRGGPVSARPSGKGGPALLQFARSQPQEQLVPVTGLGAAGKSAEGEPLGSHQGTVKRWFPDKGYGFITHNTTGQDYYVHASHIGGHGLVPGGAVHFDVTYGPDNSERVVNLSGALAPHTPPTQTAGVPAHHEVIVTVPRDVGPGQLVAITLLGREFTMPCPPGFKPGEKFLAVLPEQ